jgi:hypothetical protein
MIRSHEVSVDAWRVLLTFDRPGLEQCKPTRKRDIADVAMTGEKHRGFFCDTRDKVRQGDTNTQGALSPC